MQLPCLRRGHPNSMCIDVTKVIIVTASLEAGRPESWESMTFGVSSPTNVHDIASVLFDCGLTEA